MESQVIAGHQELCTVVQRKHVTQSNFDLLNNFEKPNLTAREKLKQNVRNCCSPSHDCFKKAVLSFFPFIGIMKEYRIRSDLLRDIAAGLTVGVMHIPQGMAYGMLANVDPVYGLYTSFFPVIIYFFLGTSKHISIGTFAIVSLMLGGVVDKSNCSPIRPPNDNNTQLSFNDSQRNVTDQYDDDNVDDAMQHDILMCKIGYITAVSMVGAFYQFLLGLCRIGFITIYLSDPLTRALTAGAAVHVFTSQIKHVFAVTTQSFGRPLKLVYTYIDFFKGITRTNPASLVMSVICIVIIYSAQRWVSPRFQKKLKTPLPVELLMLIFCTLISYLSKFSSKSVFGMEVVGNIPTGFPAPAFPPINRFLDVAVDAFGIAIVAFAISISMAKMFAKKHGYSLNSNQELMAYGISNFFSSMFNCYMSAASLSRSVVQESVGGVTQVAGLVSCCLILVVLLAVGPLFRELPNCVLACVIIVNLRGVLLQVTDVPKLMKISYIDVMIWLVTYLAVILTDVDLGLLIGVVFSLLTVVFRTQRVHACILGRIPQTDVYEDIKRYPYAKEINRIKIFQFNASLCYTNAESFLKKLYKKTLCDPIAIKAARRVLMSRAAKNVKSEASTTEAQPMTASDAVTDRVEFGLIPNTCASHLIIDCASMVYVDAVGASTLKSVTDDYHSLGIRVSFARCNAEIYEILKTFQPSVSKDSDVTTAVKEKPKIFPTVQDAVMAAVDVDSGMQKQFLDVHGSIVIGLDSVGTTTTKVERSNGAATNAVESQAESDMK